MTTATALPHLHTRGVDWSETHIAIVDCLVDRFLARYPDRDYAAAERWADKMIDRECRRY